MKIKNFFVVVVLLICSACGFQLRGNYELPDAMDTVYIKSSNERGQLVRQLKQYLKSAGVKIVPSSIEKSATLEVSKQKSGRRVLSVDNDGKAREYEVYYLVQFSLNNASLDYSVPKQELKLTRDYFFDRLGILGASEEEAILREEMQRELARMIIERLSSHSIGEIK